MLHLVKLAVGTSWMTELTSLLPALGPIGRQDTPPPGPGLGMAMKSLACSFHLQELGRNKILKCQHQQMGRKGVDLQALVSPVFFNAWRKSRFFCTLYPATVQGLPWLRADAKAWVGET